MLEARIVAARTHAAELGPHGEAQGAARMTPASDGCTEKPVIAHHRAEYADDVRTIRASYGRATETSSSPSCSEIHGCHSERSEESQAADQWHRHARVFHSDAREAGEEESAVAMIHALPKPDSSSLRSSE
jgi:hypothetical protein